MKYLILFFLCNLRITTVYASGFSEPINTTFRAAPCHLVQVQPSVKYEFPPLHHQQWKQTSGILDKCQSEGEIDDIPWYTYKYTQEKLALATDWMKTSGAWDKCQNAKQVFNILRLLRKYTSEDLTFITQWMRRTGVWDKCQNGEDVSDLLEQLRDFSCEGLNLATEWMQTLNVLDKCLNGTEVSYVLEQLKDFSNEGLTLATEWIQTLEVLDKCQDGTDISHILLDLKDYSSKRLAFVIQWMKTSRILDKCQDGTDISYILEHLKDYSEEALIITTEWLNNSGVLDKCENGDNISKILEHLKDYSKNDLIFITQWINASGIIGKCQNAWEISNMLWCLKGYFQPRLAFVTEWMKASGMWDKCRNGTVIRYLLSGLKNFDTQTLCDAKENLSLDRDFLPIYIIGATLDTISERCKMALQKFIENSDARANTIHKIADILGENDAITQEYLLLALGYDNSDNPDGFLAVYREMMQKREEPVQHFLRTQTHGVVLNLAYMQDPRAAAPIHMPLNVWSQLFDSFKKVEKESITAIFGEISYNTLLELESNSNITDLLDPKDSLVTKDHVSSYSFMLRDVLKQIQTLRQIDLTATMASFSQLLVNITTCPTGKLNGITHTYLLMNKDTVLDESELGSTAFTQGIIHHFKEELRRFREGTLSAMVKSVVKGPNIDPHDIYYVRGIIGGDIGLMFAGEVPRIDMNGNVVSPNLRQMSKQNLLDLFYQYYTVEEVVKLFHTKLNNGSFKIEDMNSGKNLTLKVINEFLREAAFDVETERYNPDYVVVDPSGKPIGLTPAAAKNLLLQLGFLTAVQH